mmetsp:Transcript_14001/g.30376  ORF Transcript_14001/g.30376 Transcript_14001/m.30376 type:complete len:125 (+) Transcript_14001:360-734(+)
MEIFNAYTGHVEKFIDTKLTEAVEGFAMPQFMEMLLGRREELEGTDVFEVLFSLADFATFKEIMLSHKREHIGRWSGMQVDVRASVIHTEEDEEGGVVLPDLNLSISPGISPTVEAQGGGKMVE